MKDLDWGIQCGNVPVKNNTCLFFSFQKGYLLIYFFIRIGRVDNFHSPYLNLKWPTLTHPPPSIVKRLAPTRHASSSGRSVRHFCVHGTSMTKHNFVLGFATGSPMMIATPNTIVRLLHCSIFCRLSFVWSSSPSQSMNYAHYQWWMHWRSAIINLFPQRIDDFMQLVTPSG